MTSKREPPQRSKHLTPKTTAGVAPQPTPENTRPVENGGSAGAASEVAVTTTMRGSAKPTPGNPVPPAAATSELSSTTYGTQKGTTVVVGENATSNSDVIIEGHAVRCRNAIERGRVAGAQSLEAYRGAGHELREAKKICPHGTFGRVIAQCGCTRAWAARLMNLDEIWDEILAARTWAETTGRPPRSKEFTVDGAIQLVREYHGVKNGKPANRRRSRNEPSRLKEVLAELATVEGELAAAKARIESLEAEVSAFSTASKTERQPLDAEIKE